MFTVPTNPADTVVTRKVRLSMAYRESDVLTIAPKSVGTSSCDSTDMRA